VRIHLDLPKFFVDDALNADRLSVQVPKLAGGLHPRFSMALVPHVFPSRVSLHGTMIPL
jgi:hypothetical protein